MRNGKIKAMSVLTGALMLLAGCGAPAEGTQPARTDLPEGGAVEASDVPPAQEQTAGTQQELHEAMTDPIDDNYRVFYEIFVGSFSDSDGDGVGDLNGVTARLDYLNDGDINSGKSLGVQGVWLTPIFSSSSYHKYDVMDYYKIARQFGSMDDLKRLIDECHARNMKIILDLPINHTSSANAWFQSFVKARADGDTENEYYSFYTCCTADEKLSGHGYSPVKGTDLFYECNFSDQMPELDFDNERVREETLNIAKYYLDLGVDGFRFDAAKYIYYLDNERTAAFWEWYMGELRAVKPDIYCVGECWASDADTLKYYGAMNCFNFQTAMAEGAVALAAKGGKIDNFTSYIEKYLKQIEGKNPDPMLVPFIANHDNDRAAGFLSVGLGQMKMGANLYLLCSGSPFIYYGEEIGMKGSRGSANTDANRRLAMLWGDGDKVKDPEGTTYASAKQTNGTVASQLDDGESLLNHYRRLIAIRNENPEIARGSYKSLSFGEKNIGGFKVTFKDSVIGIIHNTSQEDTLTVDLNAKAEHEFSGIAACIGAEGALLSGGRLTLPPLTSVIVR